MVKVLEKKKRDRQERIYRAALKLFNEKGFSRTSMKDIALEADLGVGTLYNYHASKNDLIIHLVTSATEEILAGVEEFIHQVRSTAMPPRESIRTVLEQFTGLMVQFNRKSMQEIFGAFFSSKNLTSHGIDLDLKFLSSLEKLIEYYREQGSIRCGVVSREVASLIYGMTFMNIMSYVYLDTGSPETLTQSLSSQLDLVFEGLEPATGGHSQ